MLCVRGFRHVMAQSTQPRQASQVNTDTVVLTHDRSDGTEEVGPKVIQHTALDHENACPVWARLAHHATSHATTVAATYLSQSKPWTKSDVQPIALWDLEA